MKDHPKIFLLVLTNVGPLHFMTISRQMIFPPSIGERTLWQ